MAIKNFEPSFEPVDELADVILKNKLKKDKLRLAIALDPESEKFILERDTIHITDGKSAGSWKNDSIVKLFRGNEIPPSMEKYPDEYLFMFYGIESCILLAETNERPPSDGEFITLFSSLAKRPDGRSLGFYHDLIWQAAALQLGLFPVSQLEYEAVLSRLARSARTWKISYSSRNYFQYLKENFNGD